MFCLQGAKSSVLVPIMVFGLLMLGGGELLFLLPETHNHKLPDVIADVEGGGDNEGEEEMLEERGGDGEGDNRTVLLTNGIGDKAQNV